MSIEPTKKVDSDDAHLGVSFQSAHTTDADEKNQSRSTLTGVQTSHLSNKDDVFNVTQAFTHDSLEEGTIVSDRRHERPSLSQNLHEAFTEWWGKTKVKASKTIDTLSEITTPDTPVVEKAETRVHVIEQAVQKENSAPKDDHHIVVEKMRTFKQDVEKVTGKPLTIKGPEAAVGTKGSWEHTNDGSKASTPSAQPSPIRNSPDFRETMIAPLINQKIKSDINDFGSRAEVKQEPEVTVSTPAPVPQTPSVRVPDMVSKKPRPLLKPNVSVAPLVREETQNVYPRVDAEDRLRSLPKIASFDDIQITPPSGVLPHMERATPVPVAKAPEPVPFVTAPPAPEEIKEAPIPTVSHEPAPTETTPSEPVSQEARWATYTDTESSTVKRSVSDGKSGYSDASPTPHEPASPPPAPVFHSSTPATPVKQVRTQVPQASRVSQPALVTPEPQSSVYTKENVGGRGRVFLKWALLVLIALIGAALALLASMHYNIFESRPAEEVPTTPLVVSDPTSQILLTGSKASFVTELSTRMRETSVPVQEFFPIIPSGESIRNATAAEILTFLEVELSASTIRSLDSVMSLGSVLTTTQEPFIILKSRSFDVLFAGLLAWEPNMNQDLAPLFGQEIQGVSRFKDAVRNNASTRILYDDTGKEILLYSFINPNTVVITTSGEALAKLLTHF